MYHNWSLNSVWAIDGILTRTTDPDQSGSGSNSHTVVWFQVFLSNSYTDIVLIIIFIFFVYTYMVSSIKQ